MEFKWEDNVLTIKLPQKIDATNAADAEAEIDGIRNQHDAEKIILDASDMEYISSAGLRVIIKLVKREKSVVVSNVSPVVYDIFAVSGFTNFITVERADA